MFVLQYVNILTWAKVCGKVVGHHGRKVNQMAGYIYGFGVNDIPKSSTTPQYKKWVAMIQRCYCQKTLKRQPTYKGCEVSQEWSVFSNFKSWMDSQDWEGKALDKDLLGCGKLYSPKNCCFIPRRLNMLIEPVGCPIDLSPKKLEEVLRAVEGVEDVRVLEAVRARWFDKWNQEVESLKLVKAPRPFSTKKESMSDNHLEGTYKKSSLPPLDKVKIIPI